MAPPEHHRAIARHIAATWQVKLRVEVWSAEGSSTKLALAIADDFPVAGMRAYATIGLNDHGRYEVAAIASMSNPNFVKAVFDLASFIEAGTRRTEPGAIFEKIISQYYTNSETAHVLLTPKAIPGTMVEHLSIGNDLIKWLYAWPITSDELATLNSEGVAAFEQRLRTMTTDEVVDLKRKSLPGIAKFDPWASN